VRNSIISSAYRFLPFVIIILGGYWMSKDNPYFWDTIQFGSEHAHWYYENNFAHFLLPESIDSGHPPVFGMYIALWWMALGKALWVSHLSMLSFTFLSLFLLFKIGDKIVGEKYSWLLVLLCVSDPVIAAQHILVSPDIVVFSGTLLCLHGILGKRKIGIMLGALLLGSISMRGMMVACAFGLFEVITYITEQKGIRNTSIKNYWQLFVPYLPSVLFFGGFLWYHYAVCGWIGYHENSPWASSFERVGWQGILRNFLVAGFRFVEFGRIGLIISLLIIFNKVRQRPVFPLLLLFSLFVLCLIIPQLFYRELLGSRYLIPLFLLLHILFIKVLFQENERPGLKSSSWTAVVVLVLVTGNVWQYPKGIAMGWDASLAHTFYFKPRQQMLEYIEQQKISLSEIGSSFPEYGPLENIDLKGDKRSMEPLDLNKQKYIYYSNTMNLRDEALIKLEKQYEPVQEYSSGTVQVVLYRKKNNF
jgi:hypothetical protein